MLRIFLLNSLKSFALIVLLAIGRNVDAQIANEIVSEKTGNISFETPDIIGLWKVDQVTVGDQNLTPTAKWFLFENNGSMTSGNGWAQNSSGNWTYYEAQLTLLQTTPQQADEFGAFQVAFEEKNMIWQRMEEGEKVIVTLSRTNEKPLAPWDEIVGRWKIKEQQINSTNNDIPPSANFESWDSIFIMWDRAYRKFNEDNQQIESGIWHIGGHSNEVWLINNDGNAKAKWQLTFENNEMIWVLQRDNELIKVHFEKIKD
uniref:hypothetical protein n=1 Tax=Roseivirga sp. TaxID=1964215 RepID=UPI004048E204